MHGWMVLFSIFSEKPQWFVSYSSCTRHAKWGGDRHTKKGKESERERGERRCSRPRPISPRGTKNETNEKGKDANKSPFVWSILLSTRAHPADNLVKDKRCEGKNTGRGKRFQLLCRILHPLTMPKENNKNGGKTDILDNITLDIGAHDTALTALVYSTLWRGDMTIC